MKRKKVDTLRIIALIFIFFGIIYFYLYIFIPRLIPYPLRIGMPHKRIVVLLLGTDLVYDKKSHRVISNEGHTDTIILINISPFTGKTNLLSIPRDTLVEVPGYGYQKINSAHYLGGEKLIKETVSKFLGAPIDHYAILNPRGLIKLIDLLGGIRVYVEKDMYYVDNWGNLYINLKKGWQTLSGEDAHGYIRFRSDPLGDISRVQRQQTFLRTLFSKFKNPLMLVRMPWVIGIAKENVKTDLSFREIIEVGNFVRSLGKNDIRMIMLPGHFTEEAKACFWMPDRASISELVNKYFPKSKEQGSGIEYIPSFYVSIINNSNDPNLPKYIIKKLVKEKFIITNVISVVRDDYSKTKIIAQKGDEDSAKKLGEILGINDVSVSSTGDVLSDFTIILCKDYKERVRSL